MKRTILLLTLCALSLLWFANNAAAVALTVLNTKDNLAGSLRQLIQDAASSGSMTPDAPGILYFVNTTSDTVVVGACENGTANCSLRAAIQAANNHPGADGIEIDLPAGSTINLTQALPVITDSVSITGPGANDLTVHRNTSAEYRIFDVNTTGTVTFSGLTITGGQLASFVDDGQFGAGIRNNGSSTINIINCIIAGNTVNGNALGGGIFNPANGVVSLLNSTVIGNQANDDINGAGGGIANRGTLTVSNCTIAANTAQVKGGGIYSRDGTLNVTNSTITHNSSNFGGGIYSDTTDVAKITNSTITSNLSGFEGVANTAQSTMTVKSCLIALNADSNRPDVSGVFISNGFNLVSKVNGSTGFTDPTDQTGTIAVPIDARLDPDGLRNNGGPTQSIALLPDSPAIDKGTSVGLTGNLTADQRATPFPRKVDNPSVPNPAGGDGTDIGAYEFWPFRITSISRLPGGTIHLQGLGAPNRSHRVQGSAVPGNNGFGDLNTAFSDSAGVLQFDDPDAIGLMHRFYRFSFP